MSTDGCKMTTLWFLYGFLDAFISILELYKNVIFKVWSWTYVGWNLNLRQKIIKLEWPIIYIEHIITHRVQLGVTSVTLVVVLLS